MIEARRPDLIIIEKERRQCWIIHIAVPGDKCVSEKEKEKVNKYQDLKYEIACPWELRKVEA